MSILKPIKDPMRCSDCPKWIRISLCKDCSQAVCEECWPKHFGKNGCDLHRHNEILLDETEGDHPPLDAIYPP
jgi:uncharacterized UBP type Zn finger protein